MIRFNLYTLADNNFCPHNNSNALTRKHRCFELLKTPANDVEIILVAAKSKEFVVPVQRSIVNQLIYVHQGISAYDTVGLSGITQVGKDFVDNDAQT